MEQEKVALNTRISTINNTSGEDCLNYIDVFKVPANEIAVCHHGDNDGVIGAVCIKAALKDLMNQLSIGKELTNEDNLPYNEEYVNYISMEYGREVSQGMKEIYESKAKVLIFVDFCPKISELYDLYDSGINRIFIFDHHESQLNSLEKEFGPIFEGTFGGNVSIFATTKVFYDLNQAGCGIAYTQFINESIHNDTFIRNLGWFSNYAEDYDLWKFELERSVEVNAGITLAFKTMRIAKNIEKLYKLFNGESLEEAELLRDRFQELQFNPQSWNQYPTGMREIIAKIGISKCGFDDDFVKSIVHAAKKGEICKVFIGGIEMFLFNNKQLISKVGNALTVFDYPSCQWFVIAKPMKEPELVLSFRSTNDLPDVSLAAVALGGGGHRNSCGATLQVSQLVDLLNGKL